MNWLSKLLGRKLSGSSLEGGQGEFPLHEAARKGDSELIQEIIGDGTDVMGRDGNQFTPLHIAANEGHLEACVFLLKHGADINARAVYGEQPLLMAITDRWAARANPEVVRLLVEHGADVQAMDDDGWTPLYAATVRANKDIAEILIKHGSPVKQKTNFGDTALMRAIREKRSTNDFISLQEREKIIDLLSNHLLEESSELSELSKHIKDGNDDIISYKADRMYKIGEPVVELLILSALDKSINLSTRKYCIRKVGNIGDERAIEPLKDIMSDEFDRYAEGKITDSALDDGLYQEASNALKAMGHKHI